MPLWGRWLSWDGTRWVVDHEDIRVGDLAAGVARNLWADVADAPPNPTRDASAKWAKRSEASTTIAASIRLARSLPGVSIDNETLDADPMLLNTPNGTIELGRQAFREHRSSELLTRQTGAHFDPAATSPNWEAFLADILDPELIGFLQRAVGYSLTGATTEQVLFLMVGDGANGKSTLINALEYVLGDYAGTAARDLLIAQRHEQHPTSVADLRGVRLAVGVETEATDSLAESRVKQLTGGDRLKARRMREDFWHFMPTHKLWLATNFLPRIRGRDHAVWRRIRVIPFEVIVPEHKRDPRLSERLRSEASGILNWCLAGCAQWHQRGLDVPDAVTAAVDAYRTEQDWLARFCEAKELEIMPGAGQIFTTELTEKYRDWCLDDGEQQLSGVMFARELEARGCEKAKAAGKRIWKGIYECS